MTRGANRTVRGPSGLAVLHLSAQYARCVMVAVLAMSSAEPISGAQKAEDDFEVLERLTVKPTTFRVYVTQTGELRPRDVLVVPGPIHGEILELAPVPPFGCDLVVAADDAVVAKMG